MLQPTQYRYLFKSERMLELKTQFYRFSFSKNSDQQHLSKLQLIYFLIKEGLDIKLSDLAYYDKELFKEDNKNYYNCQEAITLADRLSISPEVQKEYQKVFRVFDPFHKQKCTAQDFKKGMSKCKGKTLDDKQIEQIFSDLDIDNDGLVSFEDFLCAMISK